MKCIWALARPRCIWAWPRSLALAVDMALADGLATLHGLEVDAEGVETNMVFIDTGECDAAALAKRLDELGIRLLAIGQHTLRAVTNLTVTTEEIAQVITAFEESL